MSDKTEDNKESTEKLRKIKPSFEHHSDRNSGTLFFLSFDIVNSTVFKNIKPSKWIKEIENFYASVRKSVKSIDESARIWKKQGDEVLIYFTINSIECIPEKIVNIYNLLNILISKLTAEDGQSILSIKATLWTAYVSTSKIETDKVDIKEYETLNLAIREPKGGFDFIGPDIDFGFRIASHNAGKIICIDPKIIAMIALVLSNKDL